MTQWAEIRHQHQVDGVPKKELARRFQIDVKTVRRALQQAAPEAWATGSTSDGPLVGSRGYGGGQRRVGRAQCSAVRPWALSCQRLCAVASSLRF